MSKPSWEEVLALHGAKFTVNRAGCWLWNKALHDGYGWVAIGCGKAKLVHRMFYEAKYGVVIPDGFEAHHTCGVRRCVNPEHIEPKEKSIHLSEHKTRKPFTQEILNKMIELYKEGYSLRWLARRFKARSVTIRKAISEAGINIKPKHITDFSGHTF